MTTANHEPEEAASARPAMTPALKRIGLILVFLWFLFGGVAHFAVTPANVYMLQHAELFNVPRWVVLIVRLPFQAALLALILWSTWTPRLNRPR